MPIKLSAFDPAPGGVDNTEVLRKAIQFARAIEQPLVIPSGVYGYSDLLNLDSVQLVGEPGAELRYLNVAKAAIYMRGDAPGIANIKLSGPKATARLTSNDSCRIVVHGASRFKIRGVVIDSGAGAGIMTTRGASDGSIIGCNLSGTLADSIHMTDRSHHITVEDNTSDRTGQDVGTGDDGIACVSYKRDGGMVHDITARRNKVIGNTHGRGISVVGGETILIEDNEVQRSVQAAGIIIAQEEGIYKTFGARNVIVRHNTLVNCGNTANGHFSILVVSAGGDTLEGVLVERNAVVQNTNPAGGIAVRLTTINGVTASFIRNARVEENVVLAPTPLQITALNDTVLKTYTGGRVGIRY